MRRLTSIVALNEEGAIGAGNALPWRIRSDLRFFRQTTIENVVIMGRRTYDSLGKCLPQRTNVIVTHRFSLFPENEGCRCSGGIVEAMVLADRLARKPQREVFVVGGASMYEQFSPYVDRYLITEVRKRVPGADTYFEASILGNHHDWHWQTLIEGKANPGEGDEADFRIFEAVAKDPRRFEKERNEAMAAFASAGNLAVRRGAQKTHVAARA